MKTPPAVREWLKQIGKIGGEKGGKSTSPAKIAAARANGRKHKAKAKKQ